MPYFLRGLLVVLAFVVTRIIHLTRKNKKEKHTKKEKKEIRRKRICRTTSLAPSPSSFW